MMVMEQSRERKERASELEDSHFAVYILSITLPSLSPRVPGTRGDDLSHVIPPEAGPSGQASGYMMTSNKSKKRSPVASPVSMFIGSGPEEMQRVHNTMMMMVGMVFQILRTSGLGFGFGG